MGEVYRATHVPSGLPVAVKVVHAHLAARVESREGFRNEVRAVASLDHPAVVRVFDHGVHERQPYLVMELLSGDCMDRLPGRLSWDEVQGSLLSLLDALAHAHARGVVHRDIKPANVLVEADRVVLTDFGLAHALEQATASGIAGTPTYMAPEQFRGRWRDYGPWTDLYSLGILAWELVCGRPPFGMAELPALHRAHTEEALPPLRPVVGVPEGLEGFLHRLLRKDPRARFQRAADAAWALHGLGEAEESPTLVPMPERATRHTFGTLSAGPALTWMGDTLIPDLSVDLAGERIGTDAAPANVPEMPTTWRRVEPRTDRLLPGAGLGLVGLRRTRMVGRQAERDIIWRALGRAASGQVQVVVLRGPAGIGKSRLAQWMCERAHETGAGRVLAATHGPIVGPDHGLAPMLARHLGCIGLRDEKLRKRLILRFSEDETDALADFMAPMAGRQRFARPKERFAVIRQALTGRRTTLIWLDDAQWGLDALGLVTELLAGPPMPVLVLLTVQEEALATEDLASDRLRRLQAHPAVQTVRLEGLADAEQRELVHDLLGLSGELADEVRARSDGSPLFAVEVLEELVERGSLELADGGFRLKPGRRAELPANVKAIWSRRLGEVLATRKTRDAGFLRLAAALGTSVVDEEWEAACRLGAQLGSSPEVDWEDVPGLDPPLAALRETLVEARLARRTSPNSWSFVHAMLREALGPSADDHRVCAYSLAGQPERVARHLLASRSWLEALEPLDEAIAQHRLSGAFGEAHRLLHRKAEALRALNTPDGSPVWADLLAMRAAMHRMVGDFEAFEAESAEAEQRARSSGSPVALARVLRGRGETRRQRGAMDEAEACFREALPLLRGRDDTEEVDCWRGLGDVLRQTRRLTEAESAYKAGVQVGDARGTPACERGLATLAQMQGDHGTARSLLASAEAGFRASGSRIGRANCLNDLGDLERELGNGKAAELAYRKALAIYRSLGAYADIWPRVNLGLLWLQAGKCPRAWLEEVLVDVRRIGIPSLEGGILVALSLAAAEQADLVACLRNLTAAEALLERTGDADPDNVWPLERLVARASRAGQTALVDRAGALLQQQVGLLARHGATRGEAQPTEPS